MQKLISRRCFSGLLTAGLGAVSFGSAAEPVPPEGSRFLRESVNGNPRLIDLALLGAHDAFTHRISATSPVAPGSDFPAAISGGTPGRIGAALSRAQKRSAAGLLRCGVRYFDVRAAFAEGVWYAVHGLLSAPLADYLREMVIFLSKNPGEFVVFDIQHVTPVEKRDVLLDFIATVEVEGKSLFSFAAAPVPPEEMRYREVTAGATRAAAVVLVKGRHALCLAREEALRSHWHNCETLETLLSGIRGERVRIEASAALQKRFRVNQAQLTPRFSLRGAIGIAVGESLLALAAASNRALLAQPDFDAWLSALPIVMVDYADSPGFYPEVLERLARFNRKINTSR